MCGITGWVDWERDLAQEHPVILDMTDTMACRGPDAQGVWLSSRAGLGHRRLAVIDPLGGTQPMSVARRSDGAGDDGEPAAVLTYSGELYNFRELRTELEGHGHLFRTRSDTEVALRAYLQWGADCVRRFNGMFAFAIWDTRRQELLLARDRMGIKPLYYHVYDDGVLFGSEPKALLANPLFDAEIDDEGLAELFAMFGSHTPEHGVLRGLKEVRPGWVVHAGRGGVRPERYWELVSEPHHDDEATTVGTVRDLLADTVRRQLISDVPLCVLVSGGVDSSAIAALAAGSAEELDELATYAVDFAGSDADFVPDQARPSRDAPYVHQLVEHIGSHHSDVVLDTPDLLSAQRAATAARDLPALGDLDASLYLLFKAIRGHSTVALSGESADEVFGGYSWFHDPDALALTAFPWTDGGPGLARALSPELRRRICPEAYVADRYQEALAEVPRLPGETGEARRMREVSYLALTRFLPMLLDRKDRMSMATGLEVRVPFCDHRLVEYVWNVPWETKSLHGVPKGLLRAAVADLLPADLAQRPKSIFPAPPDPGYDAALRSLGGRLLDGDSTVGSLLDPVRVGALVDGSAPQPPWRQRLALAYLIQVDAWLRSYPVRVVGPGCG